MMAIRKLQAEIDRTLKGVALGVEAFEGTMDKLGHATNATQKDKLENDLKSQIKKLQRMRDQIKSWLGSSDIKDKTALTENRKLIEIQMEKFKVLEKEMKMKAFSKEGLIAQSKLDPAERKKRDMIDWVGTMTEELARQIEATEAELEGLATMKKKKSGNERAAELEELNERRNWHIGRLEIIQRMLENGQLSCEAVEGIQEDVKYFVESNAEEDFDYDIGIYDELNLQDEEDFNDFAGMDRDEASLDSSSLADASENVSTSAPLPKTPAKEETPAKDKKATPSTKTTKDKKDDTSAIADETSPPSPVLSKKAVSRKSTMDSTKAELPKFGNLSNKDVPPVPPIPAATASPVTANTTTPQTKPTLPPIRYAAAAAAAVAATSPATNTQTVTSPIEIISPTRQKLELPPELPVTAKEAPTSATNSRKNSQAVPPPPGLGAIPAASPSVIDPLQSLLSPIAQTQTTTTNGSTSATSPVPAMSLPSTQPQQQSQQGQQTQPTQQPQNGPPPGYPAESSRAGSGIVSPKPRQQQQGVLGSLMQSFDVAKEMAERRGNDVSQLNSAIEASFQNAPIQSDTEPPRYYQPKNPIKTPSYYPQTSTSILCDKSLYERLDVDQLFFIFYYYSGSYEQYLASEKLKRLNWRFHKQYLTWFKRAHNPQAITEEYEQGGYFYFDWENSWCQRKKSDFRFEYRWLSDS